VSVYIANAHFTAGAAHSNAEIECRTQSLNGDHSSVSLSILGKRRLEMALAAIDAFVSESRDFLDYRDVEVPPIDRTFKNFLVLGPRTLLLCIGGEDGVLATLRLELPQPVDG